ncbi:MAG: Hpt domain-containing protein [Deltaproteobacteria bacterium]
MPVTQLFDRKQLLENFDNDEEFAESILNDAGTEIAKEVERLKALCVGEDLAAISMNAHTIKGMAANLCTPALWEICFKVETAAKDGDLESARSLLPELEQTAKNTLEVILNRGEI